MRTKAALFSLLLLFSQQASASLISSDSAIFGADTITRDTDTGLEWLDVHLSINQSFEYVSSQFGVGGEYEGFRHATADELDQLIENYIGHSLVFNYGPRATQHEEEVIDGLVELLGNTDEATCLYLFGETCGDHYGGTRGLRKMTLGYIGEFAQTDEQSGVDYYHTAMIMDDDQFDWGLDLTASHWGSGASNHEKLNVGHFLVYAEQDQPSAPRPVPTPTTSILFILGLLGISWRKLS